MNSRLDWLVLSDYYSIYVTNASASSAHPSKVAQPNKRLDKDSHAFFLLVALRDGIRCTSTASGRRNNVAFRFTALTAEMLVGRIPSLPPIKT